MIIDHIENAWQYKGCGARIGLALQFLKETDFTKIETGKHIIKGDEVYAMVFEYDTKPKEEAKLEAHRKYIDVQYVASGNEQMGYAFLSNHEAIEGYKEDDDFALYDVDASFIEMNKGMFAIFYPDDLHMPGIINHQLEKVKKVVVKVLV